MVKVNTPWYKYYKGIKKHLKYPNTSLYHLVLETSKKYPDNISYNYFNNKKTYKEFIEEIDTASKAFLELGVRKKDYVSICMPNTPEAIISFYALNKIGAICNMIHPLSAESEIKDFVNNTNSKVMIVIDLAFNKINHIYPNTTLEKIITVSPKDSMPTLLQVGYELTKGIKVKLEKNPAQIKWNEFIKLSTKYNKKVEDKGVGEDLAAILYSGGTSGSPKGIELTNLNFNACALQSIEGCHTLYPGIKVLAIMPIFHGFGLGVCIHTTQVLGGTSIIEPTFNVKTFDNLLSKYNPNVLVGVPTLFEALLLNKNMQRMDLSYLTCVLSGGDSLSIELKKKVDDFLKTHNSNTTVREGYGLTESVTACCLTPVDTYKKGSIGIPYPDTYFKIVKIGTQEEASYGEEGEICLSSPSLMRGYMNNEKETKETLKVHEDGLTWLHTGDLGYMDSDGFVYFKGRLKRMIVSSGYNIYPKYIENLVDSHPSVLISSVVAKPHPYKQHVAKCFIVLTDEAKSKDKDTIIKEIKDLCEKNLSKFSWPYEYEIRDELPKTLVGKIAYKVLEDEEKEKYIREQALRNEESNETRI